MGMLIPLLLASAAVALLSASLGLLLIGSYASASAAHPFVLSSVCGLMIGIGVLVILPETLEGLVHEAGWHATHVLLLFLSSMFALFVLDHCCFEHTHLPPRTPAAAAPPSVEPDAAATLTDAPPAGCEPCEDPPPPPPPPPPPCEALECGCTECGESWPPPGFSRRRRAFRTTAQLLAADEARSGGEAAGKAAEARGAPRRTWRRAARLTLALRMCAWMLHAMIDGMLLSGATSVPALVFTVLPVGICAAQDVSAFTLSMARAGCTRPVLLTANALFAISFPLGAIASYLTMEKAGSHVVLLVIRCVVAGIFVYMAIFELSPPHSHNRYVNAMYSISFAAGALCAISIEAIEEMASSTGENE
ncbi:hypothetical protein AB1Y20_013957 [Prymnesium parvum]|uniref:Uncharacterized protein n=1 Tax=Prymnesium parvum TaxID=97485 RepID=A0AB34IGY3_PRYPA